MDHKGPKEDAEMEKLAKALGLDVEKMKKDIESQEIKDELVKDMTVAGEIGVQGTPAFIVGTTFIPGYVGEEGLKQAIADVRAKAKGGAEAKPETPDAPKKDG
jgi:predicted DsbA family dithiol-disulfide isomerase